MPVRMPPRTWGHAATRMNMGRWCLLWLAGGWQVWRTGWSLHSAAVVAQHFALLAQVLGVLLALVGHVQAIGLLQGSLQRGRRKRAQGGDRRGQQERQKHGVKQEELQRERRREREVGEREGARQTHREGPESVYCVTEVVSQGTRAFPASHCPWRHRLRPLTVLGLEPGLWGGVLSPQPGSGCHLAIPQYSMSSHHLQLTKAQGRDRQEHRLIQIRKPRPRAKKTQDHTS